MKPNTVRTLLSRLTEQLVLYFSAEGRIDEPKEFAELLAVSTWEGLVLLLRQSLANSDDMLWEEVGHFKKDGSRWLFEPAASVAEADAIKLPTPDEREYLTQKALFYLNEGTQLLASIPEDQDVSSTLTAEEKLERAVFLEASADHDKLSGRLDRIASHLQRTAFRLRAPEQMRNRRLETSGSLQILDSLLHPTREAGEIFHVTRDPATKLYDAAVEETRKAIETARERASKRESERPDVMGAIEAGKKAYQDEKRQTEAAKETENKSITSEG